MTGLTVAERRAERFLSRQHEFLLAAIARMRRDGLSAVNLTDLAADSPYSKGTWYNHFRSAESLYVEIAVVNADIQFELFSDIDADSSLNPADRLASVFISSVAHAATHPEIWTLGINARIWDKKQDAGVAEAVERLTAAEHRNYELILYLARATEAETRGSDGTSAGLDLVRAAADGLGVLTTAKSEHRWSREVSTSQTGALIISALAAGGFEHPTAEEMNRLCTLSWDRTARLTADWLIPRT